MLKRIITVVLMSSFLSCGMTSFANTETDAKNTKAVTTYDEENTSIMVTADEPQFTIKLKSNPTTGYSWFLREYDTALIEPVGHRYEAPTNQLIGASGFEIWTFKVKPIALTVPHQTSLRMVYARPWTKTDSSTQLVFHVMTQGK